jgi:short-subunit dehydrogenase
MDIAIAMKNILITGASSGLGVVLSQQYASEKTQLILWGRNAPRLNATAEKCRQRGAAVETHCFDLTDIAAVIANLRLIDEKTPLDLAILNAGVGGTAPQSDFSETPERAEAMAMVNFTSPVMAATVIAEDMARRRHGHIVFVGSVADMFPLPMAPSYAGAKAGLAMFAESLRLRMAKHKVAVTLVVPGFIDTPMSRQLTTPKPFMVSADAAARHIVKKLRRKPARIIFPWPYAVLCAVAKLAPRWAVNAVLNRV